MEYVEAAGARIPAPGFGTFELDSDATRTAVHHALDVGYRHVDTAQMYRNEDGVGAALRDSGLDRGQVFVTTKIWPDRFREGKLQRTAEMSLRRLGLEQVDLLLLHWPNPEVPLEETIGALLDAQARGITRHVGVSNFPSELLRRAVEIAGEGRIATNQVEYHPFLRQRAILDTARELGTTVSAYCPLARGRVFGDPVLGRIARHHDRNEAQVALRWLLDQGIVPLPRTGNPEHATSNLDVFDFRLSDDEHDAIATELPGDHRLIDPAFAPAWDPT